MDFLEIQILGKFFIWGASVWDFGEIQKGDFEGFRITLFNEGPEVEVQEKCPALSVTSFLVGLV